MTRSIQTIFILLFCAYVAVGQDIRIPFERVYPAQMENHLTLDMDTLAGGGFITLALEENSDEKYKRMNVTAFDSKGNIDWTRTYEYNRDQELLPVGNISTIGEDSIMFSVAIDTVLYNRVITTISSEDGAYGSSALYHTENQAEVNFEGRSRLIDLLGEGRMHVTDLFTSDGNDILINVINSTGELTLSKSLNSGNGVDDMIVDVETTADSMLIMLSNTPSHFIITKANRQGDVIWSKSYESPLDNYVSTLARNFSELSNGDIAVAAESTLAGGATKQQNVIHLDENGELITGFVISSIGLDISIDEIGGVTDSSIVFAGFRATMGDEGEPYMAHLRRDSTIGWASYFFRGLKREEVGFGTLNDGGAAMYISGGTRQVADIESPYLITVGANGGRNTACVEQSFVVDLGFTDFISTAVTLSEEVLVGLTDTVSVEALDYSGFTPPILSLQDTSFCPNDPINVLLDATQPGGIAYLWSGNTPQPATTTATVTEEGMYSVTVTINRDLCFILCDTANITRTELPMVEVVPNFAGYCETGEAVLAARANNAIQTIRWSTGVERETRISVTEPGTYRVTITDDCDETAIGSVSLGQADFDVDFPLTAQLDRSPLCETGMIQITLTDFTGDPNGLTWSDGSSGVTSIMVSSAGTYSVDFTSFCSGSASISVSEDDFLQEASISVDKSCGTGNIRLVSAGENIESVTWTSSPAGLVGTANTTPTINVTSVGTYTVTGVDICGESYSAEIEVDSDDLVQCNVVNGDACLLFPNAFVPLSDTEINRIFAPKNNCGNLDSYELLIYNRWGNQTFKSESVTQGWNGMKGSKAAPADVYFFYAKYSNDGVEFEEKGDLLLIR